MIGRGNEEGSVTLVGSDSHLVLPFTLLHNIDTDTDREREKRCCLWKLRK